MKDEKIDLLINLVYAEPAIWDLRSDAYKNRDKSVLWARIAKKAGFKDFSDAKSKWRYLRTEFGRQRRKELRGEKELGSDGGVKKPWCYYEALSFLDAFYLDGEFEPSFKVTPNRQQNAPVKRTNNQSEAFEVESAPKISRQREEAELELWARTVAFRVEKFEPFRRVHLRHQIEDLLYNEEIKSMMPMSSENISNYSSYANCSKSDD